MSQKKRISTHVAIFVVTVLVYNCYAIFSIKISLLIELFMPKRGKSLGFNVKKIRVYHLKHKTLSCKTPCIAG